MGGGGGAGSRGRSSRRGCTPATAAMGGRRAVPSAPATAAVIKGTLRVEAAGADPVRYSHSPAPACGDDGSQGGGGSSDASGAAGAPGRTASPTPDPTPHLTVVIVGHGCSTEEVGGLAERWGAPPVLFNWIFDCVSHAVPGSTVPERVQYMQL